MIDGLKVLFTGEELRELLDQRAARYRDRAARWRHETTRTADDATDDKPLLPEHMCRNEAARQDWLADVFTFFRERIDASEVYRLDFADLKRFKILPAKPEMLGPWELEGSTDDASDLGPFAEQVSSSPEIVPVTNPHIPGD